MFLINKIIPLYFFGALILGIIISVLWTPEPTIILKYPTPYNNITYKDKTGLCYKYVPNKTKCSKNTISVKINSAEEDN